MQTSAKEEATYEDNKSSKYHRARKDPYPARKVALHDTGHDGAHYSNAEPGIVEQHEDGGVAVLVHEVVEGEVGDESGLDPFVDEHAVY